jgi:lipoyl-dependent peroxiredoxin
MTKIEKVLYTGKTHTSGGRDGKSGSADGRLDITFVARRLGQRHKSRAIICRRMVGLFHRCMRLAAGKMQIVLPANLAVDAEVDLGMTGDSYFLQARLNVSLPDAAPEIARALVDAAHRTCPYSKATRGNIDVAINLA